MGFRSGKDRGRSGSASRRRSSEKQPVKPGHEAHGKSIRLRTYQVGALPIINHFLSRMKLEEILRQHLPPDDPRVELPTPRALLVLVRNILVSREPIYGVAEWSAHYAPDLLDLYHRELSMLHDDRLGRCLDRVFDASGPELILGVVRHVVSEFQVSLDELHNDSTTVSFYGAYDEAKEEGTQRGRPTHAITWGHSKDHRPDLKQLLYTLTVTEDGGVPVYVSTASGNVVDDTTHRDTWDLLRQLVGRADFLYVADCKVASRENLGHIAQRGGRFVTVLPATHKEDEQFRRRLREKPRTIRWVKLYDVKDDEDIVVDTFCVCKEEMVSKEGYRLLWYHSTRKKESDRVTRLRQIERVINDLRVLNSRLSGPRTRFRQRSKVETAVAAILEQHNMAPQLMDITISEETHAKYKQANRGRPSPTTKYVRQERPCFMIEVKINPTAVAEAEEGDGVFPLLTNDRNFTAEEILRAYKRQPIIEKRFSQLKTDFAVAPVYLKNVARVQGLLVVYFLVLLVQTLLERQLRMALQRRDEILPLYPESRPCRRPTTRRVLDVFEPVQRHTLTLPDGTEQTMVTELTPLHRQVLGLLKITPAGYGT